MNKISNSDKNKPKLPRQITGYKLVLGYLIFISSIVALVWLLIVEFPEFIEREKSVNPGFRISRNQQGEVYVYYVFPKTEAYEAGIKTGDVIFAINGQSITQDEDLQEVASKLVGTYGETITISIKRENESRNIAIVLGQDYVNTLEKLHISLPLVMNTRIGLMTILTIVNISASIMILVRHRRDWLAIILAIGLVNLPVSLDATWITYSQELQLLNKIQITAGLTFSIIALFLLPSGNLHIKKRKNEYLLWTVLGIWTVIYFCLRMGYIVPYTVVSMNIGIGGWVILSSMGLYLQFKRPYTPVEREQTKRVIFGVMTAVVVLIIYYLLFLYLAGFVWSILSFGQYRLVSQSSEVFLYLAIAIVEINIVLAFYRHKIWDTDFFINRTVVYGIITFLLAIIWFAGVGVLKYLIDAITEQKSTELPMVAAILSSVQVAALFKPIRDKTDKWVRDRYYKDRIDFSSALVELQPEMWEYIEVTTLCEILTENVSKLLQCIGAALYLYESRQFQLVSTHGEISQDLHPTNLGQSDIENLKKGKVVKGKVIDIVTQGFPLFVPLKVPRGNACDLIGVLSLEPRTQQRGYSRDHIADLGELGKHAGIAIHMLRLRESRHEQNNEAA